MKLHELPTRRIAIIVAEDVEAIRDLVCITLVAAGYTVLPAANGHAAIQISETFASPIDLLLTDVDVPGCGGLELAKSLLKVHPRMRVLFMSGACAPSIAEIFGEGADHLLSRSLSHARSYFGKWRTCFRRTATEALKKHRLVVTSP